MTRAVLKEAEILRSLFEQHVTKSQGKSQATFGRETGLGSASMVNQYLTGRRPLSLRSGARFAAGMGVDLRGLSPRLQEELNAILAVLPKLESSTALSEYAPVRSAKLRLEAGKKGYKTERLEGMGAFIAFRNDWLAQRNFQSSQLLAVEMNDNGMAPTLMRSDLIVLNTADVSLVDSMVFAFNYEGELRIRRVVRDAGEWWLYCDNLDRQRFPRKQFIVKQCYALGRIVHRQSESV